jgi:hypothetical protein
MRRVEVVTVREADHRFGVSKLFGLCRADHHYGYDSRVIILAGGCVLERLPLDFHVSAGTWLVPTLNLPRGYLGVVVDGDITVAEWVVNEQEDGGPFLLVRGDLRAKNVATSGSSVLVEGNVEATQTIAGLHNDGRTVVRGDAHAQVVLVYEHLMRIHGALTADLAVAGNFLKVADQGRLRVGRWAGPVSDLDGRPFDTVGSESYEALSLLDPALFDSDGPDEELLAYGVDPDAVLDAVQAGRSLLRRPQSAATL